MDGLQMWKKLSFLCRYYKKLYKISVIKLNVNVPQ